MKQINLGAVFGLALLGIELATLQAALQEQKAVEEALKATKRAKQAEQNCGDLARAIQHGGTINKLYNFFFEKTKWLFAGSTFTRQLKKLAKKNTAVAKQAKQVLSMMDNIKTVTGFTFATLEEFSIFLDDNKPNLICQKPTFLSNFTS